MANELQASARELLSAGALSGAFAPADAHIPYVRHFDAETLVTIGGALVQCVALEGLPAETASETQLAGETEIRSRALVQVGDGRIAVWMNLLRAFDSGYPQGDLPPGFAADLDAFWRARWASRQSLSNRWFVSFVHRPPARVNSLRGWIDALRGGSGANEALIAWRAEATRKLRDAVSLYVGSMRAYGPRVLTIRTSPGQAPVSEPLSFCAELVNGRRITIAPPMSDARRVVHVDRLGFGAETGEFLDATGRRRFFGMLGVLEYPSQSAGWMLDGLSRLPFEVVSTQSFVPMDRGAAIGSIEQARRDFDGAGDGAADMAGDLRSALADVQRGGASWGTHHFSVQVRGDSADEVREGIAAAVGVLSSAHITARRERRNLEPAFWAQLPGNGAYIARSAQLSSRNVAAFSSIHATPIGRLDGHKWGAATTVLESSDGSPRFFSMHVGDVGNVLIQGLTGAGKTVLGLLAAIMAMRATPRPRLIALDRDRGMDVAIRALGGRYSTLKRGVSTGWNPFATSSGEADDESRAFIVNLVELLVGGEEGVTATQRVALRKAVDGVLRGPKSLWRLSSVGAHLPFGGPDSLGALLQPWFGKGEFAWLFDGAPGATADWFSAGIAGIDLSVALDDKRLSVPVSTFVFHQVRQGVADGRLILLVDEGWRYVRDPAVLAELEGQGRTIRKLDGLMIFMSQSDEAESEQAKALIKTLATKIIFPSVEWNKARLREVFALSPREIELLTEDLPAKGGRWFLVRQAATGIVCRADLSGGGEDFVSVLSGTKDRVALCERLRAELGNDPAAWLTAYYEAVKRENL